MTMRLKLGMLGTAVLLGISGCSSMESPTSPAKNEKVSEQLDLKELSSRLLTKAQSGDATAQVALADMYVQGIGVEKNTDLAEQWYERAAEVGNVKALESLGGLYFYGTSRPKNYSKAVTYYRSAAEQGSSIGQYRLGTMYTYGYGVQRNYLDARNWLSKSAAQGNTDAKKLLDNLYIHGLYELTEPSQKVRWVRQAAEYGEVDAQLRLGEWFYYGYGKHVTQSYSQAADWIDKAASHGAIEAKTLLGEMYRYGRGVQRNEEHAINLFSQLSQQGNAEAKYYLGEMYFYGHGVKEDVVKGIQLIRDAALAGVAEAQYTVGGWYKFGRQGVIPEDKSQSLEWMIKAAENGSERAVFELGMFYYGYGPFKNPSKALQWLERGANLGYKEVQHYLANNYRLGNEIVDQDIGKAMYWYQEAAKADETDSKLRWKDGYRGSQGILAEIYWKGGLDGDYGGFAATAGNLIRPDYEKSFYWAMKAVEDGLPNPNIEYLLGEMYFQGKGVEQDFKLAAYWYEKSVTMSYPAAMYRLGMMLREGMGVGTDVKRANELLSAACSADVLKKTKECQSFH